jgi:EmrB/QacA subfamily drug resistance transporter
LAVATGAAALVVANVSTLNVALPELSRELGASQTQLQWMVDAYAVVLAALLLPAGAIGDRFGRRFILLVGLVVLAAANAATMVVDTAELVIAARAVSGVGAALVFPATLSTITATMPPERRSRGVAVWTAAVGVGGIIGILASGALVEHYWWGSVFAFMAIASAVVLLAALAIIPDSADPDEAHLDPVGAVLSLLAVGGLVFGIIEGPVKGWRSLESLAGLIGGGVALVAFAVWEYRTRTPLLDVRVFRLGGARAGSLSIFVQFTAAFGLFFVAINYLAFVRGYGPLDTGLSLLPVGAGLLPAAAVAIPLSRLLGRRVAGAFGLAVLAAAFVVGLRIETDSSLVEFVVVLALFGAGLGLSAPPATEAIVEALPPAKQGVASALNDVFREFGAAIGIAVAGSAFNAGYRDAIATASGVPDQVRDVIRESPAAALPTASGLDGGADALLDAVAAAVIDGWSAALLLLAIITGAGALVVLVWSPSRRRTSPWIPAEDQADPAPDVAPPAPPAWQWSDGAQPAPLSSVPPAAPTIASGDGMAPFAEGAVELAAVGEARLGELSEVLDRLVAALERLDGRSQVPTDFDAWPAAHQAIVCERAAYALEEPLATLAALSGQARDITRDADPAVALALAELRRLGHRSDQLPHLVGSITTVWTQVGAAGHSADRLAERFEHLAATRGVLGPAAQQIAAVGRELTMLVEGVRSWRAGLPVAASAPPPPPSIVLDATNASPEPWIAITE